MHHSLKHWQETKPCTFRFIFSTVTFLLISRKSLYTHSNAVQQRAPIATPCISWGRASTRGKLLGLSKPIIFRALCSTELSRFWSDPGKGWSHHCSGPSRLWMQLWFVGQQAHLHWWLFLLPFSLSNARSTTFMYVGDLQERSTAWDFFVFWSRVILHNIYPEILKRSTGQRSVRL